MRSVTNHQLGLIRKLTVFILFLSLVVILWGAFVRFSGSGDGCGESWPLCDGEVIPPGVWQSQSTTPVEGVKILPRSEKTALWIEFAHRMTSGILGLLVVALVALTFWWSDKGAPLRKFVAGVGFFTLSEALIGAGLVLRGLVGTNDSIERAVWIALHFMNTLILLACLAGAYLQTLSPKKPLRMIPSTKMLPYLALFLLLGLTGSLASLSNTLYPSTDLLQGMAADFDPKSPLFVRLRLLHPLIGVLFFLLIIDWWKRSMTEFPVAAVRLLLFTGTNFLIGALTLVLLSPLAGRITHILVTDLVWIQLYGLSLLVSATGDLSDSDVKGLSVLGT